MVHMFDLEDSLWKTIVLRWNEYSFCSYMGPKQVRIMDQMPSRLSVRPQVSIIKTGTYEGIGQRLIGFCVEVSVVVRRFATGDVFFLFAVNILNLSRPRLIKLEATITSLRLLVRSRTVYHVLCQPVIRSNKESLNSPGVLIRMM